MNRKTAARATLFLAAGAVLAACPPNDRDPDPEGLPLTDPAVEEPAPDFRAQDKEVTLRDGEGNEIGTATLTDEGEEGVRIHVVARNLSPGPSGIHFHEDAVCEGPDFESSGGHFNPDDREHGFDNPRGFHAGDAENLPVEPDGTVDAEVMAPRARMDDGEMSVVAGRGTALVIHDGEDDYMTDPAGDSGDRIACGVVQQGATD